MTPHSTPSADLVPAGASSSFPSQLPAILSGAGQAAIFATEEFFFGKIRNAHTRAAYPAPRSLPSRRSSLHYRQFAPNLGHPFPQYCVRMLVAYQSGGE
jgi:hypothetical protein